MANVLEFLRQFRQAKREPSEHKPGDPEILRVLALTVDEFKRESLVILVRSYLLGENIMLVSNRDCLQHVDGECVTYLPEELETIYGLSSDSIKNVHRLKKLVDGEILRNGNSRQNRTVARQGQG
jgi:hypothetical protein